MNRYGFFVTTHFNPRSREGSDLQPLASHTIMQYFNPRSREGSDFILQSLASLYIHFNPRSREGSDGFGYPDG